jgi:hypothetical protein
MSTGMFTFQGDYKRRAQVNLGRITHEDRAALLKKAQEERRAREEKRRREIAAMKIQVFPSLTLLRDRLMVRRSGGDGKRLRR